LHVNDGVRESATFSIFHYSVRIHFHCLNGNCSDDSVMLICHLTLLIHHCNNITCVCYHHLQYVNMSLGHCIYVKLMVDGTGVCVYTG
jgi:hypothetical protein